MHSRAVLRLLALASAVAAGACGGNGSTGPQPGILPGARKLALVANGPGTVTYLDRRSAASRETPQIGFDFHEIAVDPDVGRAFISSEVRGLLFLLDLEHGDTTGTIAFPGDRVPHGLALSPDRSRLYVTFPNTNEVGALDSETGDLLGVAPSGGTRPDEVAISADGRTLYLANIGGMVGVVDAATLTLTATTPVGRSPEGLRPDPSGQVLVVPNSVDGTVTLLALPGLSVLATLPVGEDPRRVAFSSDCRLAYVTNLISDTITAIDLQTRTVKTTLPTVDGPEAILVDPETGDLYVVGTVSNDLGVQRPDGSFVRRVPVGLRPEGVAFWDR